MAIVRLMIMLMLMEIVRLLKITLRGQQQQKWEKTGHLHIVELSVNVPEEEGIELRAFTKAGSGLNTSSRIDSSQTTGAFVRFDKIWICA